jgi:hypothetical protein
MTLLQTEESVAVADGSDTAKTLDAPPPAAEPCAMPTTAARGKGVPRHGAHTVVERIAEINKDVWLIVSMLAIAGVANYPIAAQKVVFGFYTLPTIFAAYCRGRRHALPTAAARFIRLFVIDLRATPAGATITNA